MATARDYIEQAMRNLGNDNPAARAMLANLQNYQVPGMRAYPPGARPRTPIAGKQRAPSPGLRKTGVNEGQSSHDGEQDNDEAGGREFGSKCEVAEDLSYTNYTPKYAAEPPLRDAKLHPDPLVENGTLATVNPPEITYRHHLPKATIEDGKISIIQLESIVYAGQKQQNILPSEERAGFMLGDGAGVGKGRQLAGMIFDNWLQGRKKAVWFSVSADLKEDAMRDLIDIGAAIRCYGLTEFNYEPLHMAEGCLFVTYASLIGKSRGGGTERTRLQQILKWLGTGFDGCLILDECHKAKNLGGSPPTQTGLAVEALQTSLPLARVCYCSATAVSEPLNLAYMSRLGLWGVGTNYEDFKSFLRVVSGDYGTMECLAMFLKQEGSLLCRTLSYQGATFNLNNDVYSPAEEQQYDAAARFWQRLWIEYTTALREQTLFIIKPPEKKKMPGVFDEDEEEEEEEMLDAHGNVVKLLGQHVCTRMFWAAHQRFFRSVCITMKVNAAVEEAKKALQDGKCVVIGLQSTGEANANDAVANNVELDESFLSAPKQTLIRTIKRIFYVPGEDSESDKEASEFEIDSDDNVRGSSSKLKLLDSKGKGSRSCKKGVNYSEKKVLDSEDDSGNDSDKAFIASDDEEQKATTRKKLNKLRRDIASQSESDSENDGIWSGDDSVKGAWVGKNKSRGTKRRCLDSDSDSKSSSSGESENSSSINRKSKHTSKGKQPQKRRLRKLEDTADVKSERKRNTSVYRSRAMKLEDESSSDDCLVILPAKNTIESEKESESSAQSMSVRKAKHEDSDGDDLMKNDGEGAGSGIKSQEESTTNTKSAATPKVVVKKDPRYTWDSDSDDLMDAVSSVKNVDKSSDEFENYEDFALLEARNAKPEPSTNARKTAGGTGGGGSSSGRRCEDEESDDDCIIILDGPGMVAKAKEEQVAVKPEASSVKTTKPMPNLPPGADFMDLTSDNSDMEADASPPAPKFEAKAEPSRAKAEPFGAKNEPGGYRAKDEPKRDGGATVKSQKGKERETDCKPSKKFMEGKSDDSNLWVPAADRQNRDDEAEDEDDMVGLGLDFDEKVKRGRARLKGLLAQAESLSLQGNPLDVLIDQLGGVDKVAELTGRASRMVRNEDGMIESEARNAHNGAAKEKQNLWEKTAFQNGEKLVAILSDAASAGISLQADRRALNQRRRVHITLELPWSADKAIQQLGRSHRANQVSAPEYHLLLTKVGGEHRFASAVAKRLEQLGALTQGDRRAASGASKNLGFDSFNIDTAHGAKSLTHLYNLLVKEREKPMVKPPEVTEAMIMDVQSGIRSERVAHRMRHNKHANGTNLEVTKESSSFYEVAKEWLRSVGIEPDDLHNSKNYALRTNVGRFLNRLLGLELERQTMLFDYFSVILERTIQAAKRDGSYEDGILTLQGDCVKVTNHRGLNIKAPGYENGSMFICQVDIDRAFPWSRILAISVDAIQKATEGQRIARETVARNSTRSRGGFQPQMVKCVTGFYQSKDTQPHAIFVIDPKYGAATSVGWQGSITCFGADRGRFMMPRGDLSEYKECTREKAKDLWEKEYNYPLEEGTDRHLRCHVLGGRLFPVWSAIEGALAQICMHYFPAIDSKAPKNKARVAIVRKCDYRKDRGGANIVNLDEEEEDDEFADEEHESEKGMIVLRLPEFIQGEYVRKLIEILEGDNLRDLAADANDSALQEEREKRQRLAARRAKRANKNNAVAVGGGGGRVVVRGGHR